MFRLIIEDKAGDIAEEFSFEDGSFVIGRSSSCDIVLPSANVSRQHARIFVEEGRVFVEDIDSVNGIVVNGKRSRGRTELGAAAQIKVGDFYLNFERTKPEPGLEDGSVRLRLHGKNLGVAGRTYSLTKPVSLIGRGRDASTTIIDSSVSRIHAKVVAHDDGRVVVEDLKSANGTFVNGEPIAKSPLEHGDRVRFGNVELEVDLPGATATLYGVTAPPLSLPPHLGELAQGSGVANSPSVSSDLPAAPESPHGSDSDAGDVTALMNVTGSVAAALKPEVPAEPSRSGSPWLMAFAGLAVGAAATVAVVWGFGRGEPTPSAAPPVVVSGNETPVERVQGSPPSAAPASSAASSAAVAVDPAPANPEPEQVVAAESPVAEERPPAESGVPPGAAPAPAPTPTPPPAPTPSPERVERAQKASAHLQNAEWAEALALYASLKADDPLSDEYTKGHNLAVLELANQAHLARGQKFVESRLWTEAARAFESVTINSRYSETASEALSGIRAKKRQLIGEADALCAKKRWKDCHTYYVEALALDPDDAELRRKAEEVALRVGAR